MIKVYTASKLSDASKWESHRASAATAGVKFHARWLDHVRRSTPDTAEFAKVFWVEDIDDVKAADYIFVLANEQYHLRGALVEAGAALCAGVPVVLIGETWDWGTWQYHPGVIAKVSTIDEAIHEILQR